MASSFPRHSSELSIDFGRTNPTVADIATISIGGNDIGFYNILTACVLRVGGYWAGDCDVELAKAYETLASPDLSANIASALTEIIDRNGKDAFKVFVTGYVTFFNETTTLCDSSSFRIYNPHYDDTHAEKDQPFLTTALRTKLNDVVGALNTMLGNVADALNARDARPKVVFVDPNPAYAGHRWCEEGVYEPDGDRLETWLFLSSMPDNNVPEHPDGADESHGQEMTELLAGPRFPLPDTTGCRQRLLLSNGNVRKDWYGMLSPIYLPDSFRWLFDANTNRIQRTCSAISPSRTQHLDPSNTESSRRMSGRSVGVRSRS